MLIILDEKDLNANGRSRYEQDGIKGLAMFSFHIPEDLRFQADIIVFIDRKSNQRNFLILRDFTKEIGTSGDIVDVDSFLGKIGLLPVVSQ